MKKVLCFLSLAFSLCLAIPALLPAGEPTRVQLTPAEQAFLDKHPTIVFGTDRGWEPFVVVDEDGRVSGYDADILHLVNRHTGANFTLVVGKWSEIVEKAKAKEIDGLSTSAVHKERAKYFAFSDIYLSLQRMAMTLKGNPYELHGFDDLSGKVIAITKGNLYEEKAALKLKEATILRLNTFDDVLSAVTEGKAHAIIGSASHMYRASKVGVTTLQFAFSLGDNTDLVFSVRNDWPEALSILNKGLAAIPEKEKVLVHNKWFGASYTKEFDHRLAFQIGVPAALLVIVILGWAFYLRKLNAQLKATRAKLQNEVLGRKQAQKSLLLEKERAENYLNISGSIILALDDEARIMLINPAGCETLGYRKEELLGRDWIDIAIPEDQRGLVHKVFKEIMSGDAESFEYVDSHEVVAKNGELKHILWQNSAITDKEGSITGLLISGVDITERKRAEEALQKSEERFRLAFDHANDGMCLVSPEGYFLWVNKRMCGLLGYSKDEFQAFQFNEVTHPEDQDTGADTIKKMLKDGLGNATFEKRYLHKDGSVVWALVSTTLLVDETGNPLHFVTHITDITERKRFEESLRKNEARLRDAQRLAKAGSWEFDIQTGEIWGSDEGFKIYGMTPPPSNLLSVDEIEACIPEKKRVHQALVDLINEDKPYDLEFDILPADGSVRKRIISKAKLERDGKGNAFRISGVIQDITELRRTEDALKRIQWLLTRRPKQGEEPTYLAPYGDVTELNTCREILDSVGPKTLSNIASQSIELLETSVAIYESNGDYAFGMFTSGWCQFMDAASRRLCGDIDNQDALACGKWLCHDNCWNDSARAAMESRQTTDIECVGGIHLYGVPILADDDVVGAINIGYGDPPTDEETLRQLASDFQVDFAELHPKAFKYESRPAFIVDQAKANLHRAARLIGEMVSRSRLEKKLVRAQATAESANRAKSEFLANMSHEIRTPLNGVLGMMQVLQESPLNEEQKECIETTINSGKTLIRVISDILDLSRIESGKMDIKEETFDPEGVLSSIQAAFMNEASKKGLAINYQLSPMLPSVVTGDSGRLRQVLFNLVGNAIKFTRQGEVNVNAYPKNMGSDSGPLDLCIEVSDTGIGIPEEQLAAIFEPFTQVDGTNTRKYGGTGLGLSIVKRLIDLMGGSVLIESELGVGTTVRVRVPVKAVAGEKSIAEQHTTAAAVPLPPLKILLAEDDPANQLVAKRLLEKQGHSVTCVATGKEALAYLGKDSFDLVLMDVQMPEMDGTEATIEIRKNDRFKGLPIIALTAHAMSGDKERFLEAGMDDYICKPIEVETLVEVIARAMKKRGRKE